MFLVRCCILITMYAFPRNFMYKTRTITEEKRCLCGPQKRENNGMRKELLQTKIPPKESKPKISYFPRFH